MATKTFEQLKEQVERLCSDGNFDDAQEAIGDFIVQNVNKPEAKEAEKLQKETAEREKQYKPDPIRVKMGLANSHYQRGEIEKAIEFLEGILQDKPDHPEALDLIIRCVDRDKGFTLRVREFLQGLPSNAGAQRALASLGEGRLPVPGRKAASAPADTELAALLDEGMRAYYGRQLERAIDIFNKIMARVPETSEVWRNAKEYAGKTKARLAEGEKPIEDIPYEAQAEFSYSKSLMRAGKYQEAITKLETAIRLCHEAGIKQHPPKWDEDLENARAYLDAEELARAGEEILRNQDDWGEAIRLWRNALRANPNDDLLKQKFELLKQAEGAVAKAQAFLKVRAGMAPEDQAERLIEVLDTLRLAVEEFSYSKRLKEALEAADARAEKIVSQLAKQAEEFLKQARDVKVLTLAEKRSAAEQAVETFALVKRLGKESAVLAHSAKELAAQLRAYEDQIKQVDVLIEGPDRNINQAELILKQVQDVCPRDPLVTITSRKLHSYWLDQAEDQMTSPWGFLGWGKAGSSLQRAKAHGESERLTTLRTSWATRVLLSRLVGGAVFFAILFGFGLVGYREVLVPYLAPTRTPTFTPTFVPTATRTSVPLPTATLPPTPTIRPTATPIGIPGKVTESLTFVYVAPDSNTQKAGFVQRDQIVIVFDQGIGPDGKTLWFHIRWDVSGQTSTGWIPAQFVQQMPR